MKYEAWLKYPVMIISIQDMGDKFRCNEYAIDNTVRRSFKYCESVVELKFFLLSFPNAPKKEIIPLIASLETKKSARLQKNTL